MRRPPTSLLAAAAALALAGCSPSSEAAIDAQALTSETRSDPVEPVGPGSQIEISGYEWDFDVLEGTAVDGQIELTFVNTGDGEHNIRFDAAVGDTNKVTAAAGEENTGVIELFGAPSGQTYTFYCDISGHRANGMEGELIVYTEPEIAETEPVTPEMETAAAAGS